jgi:copper transport protein
MIIRGRPLLCGLALVLGLCLFPGRVFAHAHLVRADLSPDGHLLVPAGTYHFWFDESLNPTLSRIAIDNAAGKQVNQDTGKLHAGNAEELDVQMPALPSGKYSVLWTSDSAQDGHILHGFYLFTAGGAGATAISAAPSALIAVAQPTLDTTSLANALAHWLVLLASTLWTGALALELLILVPFRKGRRSHHRSLADETSSSIIRVVQIGLAASIVTSLLELEGQAYAAGGWSGTVSGSVLQDILGSQYGTFWIVRVICAILALLVAPPRRPKSQDSLIDQSNRADRRAPQRLTAALRPVNLWPLGLIGLIYLLAIAYSGHAAAVSQLLVTSVLLDWLHLLANAVWVGGMAAIALALIPALIRYSARGPRYALVGRDEFLTLLDRYSPAAFIAVATAGFTGMFNAQVHLSSLNQLINTTYGRFLLIKLFLIAEIILLSASHVFMTRPRLRALAGSRALGVRAEDLFTSLLLRLRIEPLIGTLILLCVALMGQVAPGVTVFTTPAGTAASTATASVSPTPAVPTIPVRIQGSVHKGLLNVTLTITPPALGQAKFFATVRESGKAVTDGQVRIRLSVPANPALGDHFVETNPTKGGYQGSGDLVLTGHWLADVLVRTQSDPNEFRDVPFDFVAGPGATFLILPATTSAFGPATVSLAQPPNAPAVLSVRLHAGLQVRIELVMLGMVGMAPQDYPATAASDGSYRASIIFPMAGVTRVIVQVQKAGTWQTARLLLYEVNAADTAHLLAQSAVSP